MKHIQIPFCLMLVTSLIIFTGCGDDGDMMTKNTITDIVVNGGDFSVLESLVVKADLQTTLSSAGPFTVFEPDNVAYAKAGLDHAALDALTVAQERSILLYHVIPSQIAAADVPAGPNASVISASTDLHPVYVTNNTNGVFINGIPVKTADVAADNGIVHIIDGVLMPASGNMVEKAQSSGLDSLVRVVTSSTNQPRGDPALAGSLATGKLTVLTPTNAAFNDLLTALSLTSFDQISVPTLLAVLLKQIVGIRAFSSDLVNGDLTMLDGSISTIELSNGATITGASNGTNSSSIITTDIVTTNEVVHLIS